MENLTLEEGTKRFQENFNRLFKAWGGTQEKLSQELGINQSRISYWKHGNAAPTFVNLYNLARVFGCALEDFYVEVGDVPESEEV